MSDGKLSIETSVVYTQNKEALHDENIRFIINQGGTRSSKTYSIIQLLIVEALTKPRTHISIVRVSLPALKGSAIRDFTEIMYAMDIYDPNSHFMGENLYKFPNGSIIEFFSIDDPMRLRGRKRDILYINEAIELNLEQFNQLNFRTKDKIIIDFNPSEMYSWIYDLILKPNTKLIKSTYKDNPFLSENIIKELDELINGDPEYYKIYALGEQAQLRTTIYNHYNIDEYVASGETYYGLDIGFNHPMSLIKVNEHEKELFVKEEIYESNMTVNDLIDRMDSLNISKTKDILVDSARPDVIEDLKRRGYNARGADKAVKEGIDAVKSFKLTIDKASINLIKEIRNYKWKTNGDRIIDEPVKKWDDAMDAMRYAIYFIYNRNKIGLNDLAEFF